MNEDYGKEYSRLYAQHWWWRSREAMLVREIRRLHLPASAEILDVGCGDALSFPILSQFGRIRGIEVDKSLIRADNPHRSAVFSAPLGDPQYHGWQFDLITALDLVEHIENDRQAIADMMAMIRPGGFLLLTVPAFMVLWDRHDEINHHFRRYDCQQVRKLLADFGCVRQLRYLFHGLFFLKGAFKLVNRVSGGTMRQQSIPPQPLNRMMQSLCLAEYFGLGWLRVPFGTSVLAVVQRDQR
jgi:2-polyprenyl-3-methyl-5-hydroxy-6-metoxy-1,4-benzoquinol methylase